MERAGLDLNDIAVFSCVAEEASLTRAAKRLGLPKSTVSRKLTALEAAVGVRLLHRTPRSVDLTEAGRALHEEAREAVATLATAASRVAELGNALRGRIRVSVPNDFGHAVCSPLLCQFAALHPEILLEVELTDRGVDLVQEGFDFTVRVGDEIEQDLIARPVAQIRGYLVAGPTYAAAHGLPATVAELAAHKIVEFSGVARYAGEIRLIDPKGKAHDVKYRPRMRVTSLLMSREAALRGLGIVRLPMYLGAELVREKKLVRVLPGHFTTERTVRLVHTGRRLLSARVQLLMDYLAEHLPERASPPDA